MIEIDTRLVNIWHEPRGPQRARYVAHGVILEAQRHYGAVGWCWQVRSEADGKRRAYFSEERHLHPLDALRAAAAWANQEVL